MLQWRQDFVNKAGNVLSEKKKKKTVRKIQNTAEVGLSMFCFNLRVFLLNSSKNFKTHPIKNLMLILQSSVEEKNLSFIPVFSADIKQKVEKI